VLILTWITYGSLRIQKNQFSIFEIMVFFDLINRVRNPSDNGK